jgi:hypothetical protein
VTEYNLVFQLTGLFSPFPNLLHLESLAKYNDKEMSASAKFIELVLMLLNLFIRH